jgi:hypothetical protein
MIHRHIDGQHIKIGLNIGWGHRHGWPWVRFIWCWYDVENHRTFGWRLRIRTHVRPFFLFSKHGQNVIHNYLFEHDYVTINREYFEDLEDKSRDLADIRRRLNPLIISPHE